LLTKNQDELAEQLHSLGQKHALFHDKGEEDTFSLMNMFVNAPDENLVSTLLGAYIENRVEYIGDLREKYFDDKTYLPNYR
jgi:hypothetical protein